jgi:hypothetical protein
VQNKNANKAVLNAIEEFKTVKKKTLLNQKFFFLPLSPPNCSSPRSTAVNEKE